MGEVQFNETATADSAEQTRTSDALRRVQRISLALWVFSSLALIAMLVDRRWFPLMTMTALAGLTGQIVQKTGQMRLLAIGVNALVAVLCSGGIIALMSTQPSSDEFVFGLVTLCPVIVLAALNVSFLLKVPRQAE